MLLLDSSSTHCRQSCHMCWSVALCGPMLSSGLTLTKCWHINVLGNWQITALPDARVLVTLSLQDHHQFNIAEGWAHHPTSFFPLVDLISSQQLPMLANSYQGTLRSKMDSMGRPALQVFHLLISSNAPFLLCDHTSLSSGSSAIGFPILVETSSRPTSADIFGSDS